MNILNREVQTTAERRTIIMTAMFRRLAVVGVIAALLASALSMGVAFQYAFERTAAECGISDPIGCIRSLMTSDASEAVETVEEAIETRVIYTETKVHAATCGDIMDMFHTLPGDRLLEMPGLLEQVAECKALYRSSSID